VNCQRNPIVFEKLFYALLHECKNITSSRTFTFDNPLYSLDATLISLCLSLLAWEPQVSFEEGVAELKREFAL